MSLGGETTSSSSIDPALRDASLQNLEMARQIGQLGFVPYTEATVAGMSPSQVSAMQNTNAGLQAFGLAPSAVPSGADLSPYSIYQTALANMAPGQRAFIESMFINALTGAAPTLKFGQSPTMFPYTGSTSRSPSFSSSSFGSESMSDRSQTPSSSSGSSTTSLNTPLSYAPGGVNTNNPSSALNTTAANLTSGTQSAPTSSDRPVANPSR